MNWRANVTAFLGLWAACALSLGLCDVVALEWAKTMLGPSQLEMPELWEFLSAPLGLLSPAFVIRQDAGIGRICMIMAANGYFYAIVLFPALRLLQWWIARCGRHTPSPRR